MVHVPAVADADDENVHSAVLDAGDDSAVAYTVLPEGAKLATFEGFANAARLVELGYVHALTTQAA